MKRTLITNIGMLATPQGTSARGGRAQGEICILKNAWILIENDLIAQVGTGAAPAAVGVQIINAGGKLVTPGLVDAHTHLIFGGWRQNELALKLHGAGYLDILAAGGGILSTIYARLKPGFSLETVRGLYEDAYRGEPFVRVLPAGAAVNIRDVRCSNYCDIQLYEDPHTGLLIVTAVIDNMVKGAAGQAIQNMNLLFGLPETTGLDMIPPAF